MARDYADLIPRIAVHVLTCPDPVITQAVSDAARDFCARSHVWRQEFSGTTTSGHAEFAPTLAAGQAFAFESIHRGGVLVRRVSEGDLPEDWSSRSGIPEYWFTRTPGNARLYPTPDASYSLTGIAVCKPTPSETVLEDWLYDDHYEDLVHGALFRLMIVPGKDWSNGDVASFHSQAFESAIDKARLRRYAGQDMKVKTRAFA
jgi:hypothetical protein